jgi:hypothetical protein
MTIPDRVPLPVRRRKLRARQRIATALIASARRGEGTLNRAQRATLEAMTVSADFELAEQHASIAAGARVLAEQREQRRAEAERQPRRATIRITPW